MRYESGGHCEAPPAASKCGGCEGLIGRPPAPSGEQDGFPILRRRRQQAAAVGCGENSAPVRAFSVVFPSALCLFGKLELAAKQLPANCVDDILAVRPSFGGDGKAASHACMLRAHSVVHADDNDDTTEFLIISATAATKERRVLNCRQDVRQLLQYAAATRRRRNAERRQTDQARTLLHSKTRLLLMKRLHERAELAGADENR